MSGSIRTNLIGKRFGASSSAGRELSESQKVARDQFLENLKSGLYLLERTSCPLCSDSSGVIVSKRDIYGLPLTVMVCDSCSLLYSNPKPTDGTLSKFYSTIYRDLDRQESRSVENFFELQAEKGKIIFDFVFANQMQNKMQKSGLVLEVGCGAGGVLRPFQDAGYRVLGFDLGAEYLEFGKKVGLDLRHGGIAEVIEAVKKLNVPVSLVIFEQVLEHFPDPIDVLRKIRPILNEDSLVYIGVPGLKNIVKHYNCDFLQYLQIPHLIYFELNTLRKMLEKGGYRYLFGDEVVRAIFLPGGESIKGKCMNSTFLDPIEYLKKVERRWQRRNFFQKLYRFVASPMRIYKKFRAVIYQVFSGINLF